MFSFLERIPLVTKNLLLLNVVFYIVTFIFSTKGVHLIPILGAHYVNSPLFEPYQIVTHFFMHDDQSIMHIFFNMFGLVMFGSLLEKIWGPKRFFIFYIASAIGAFALYNMIGAYDLWKTKQALVQLGYSTVELNDYLLHNVSFNYNINDEALLNHYFIKSITPMVGASGAIFGIMAAFAYLFPNTELMLMFIPVPIKAKYFVSGYFLIEVYLSFQSIAGDSVAHLAHVGGAVVGFLLVLFWNKKNTKTFY